MKIFLITGAIALLAVAPALDIRWKDTLILFRRPQPKFKSPKQNACPA